MPSSARLLGLACAFLAACSAGGAVYDFDGDGVADAIDCAPEDPTRQLDCGDELPPELPGNESGNDWGLTTWAVLPPGDDDDSAGSGDDDDSAAPPSDPGDIVTEDPEHSTDTPAPEEDDDVDVPEDPEEDAETFEDAPVGDDDDSAAGVDGYTDEIIPLAPPDDDGDGFDVDNDCDDDDPTVYPGAGEACDGVDQACDGLDDETDGDGDGWLGCNDCDDDDSARYPGLDELCDGVDNDCDGVVPGDEDDTDDDGLAPCAGDCDDGDDNARPGLPEVACDGVDNDCDDGDATAAPDSYEPDDGADVATGLGALVQGSPFELSATADGTVDWFAWSSLDRETANVELVVDVVADGTVTVRLYQDQGTPSAPVDTAEGSGALSVAYVGSWSDWDEDWFLLSVEGTCAAYSVTVTRTSP